MLMNIIHFQCTTMSVTLLSLIGTTYYDNGYNDFKSFINSMYNTKRIFLVAFLGGFSAIMFSDIVNKRLLN